MNELLEKLKEPFKASEIEWRVQRVVPTKNGPKAIVLAYVTNRAIMDRLDDVCGPTGWKNEFTRWGNNGVLCGISIRHGDEWITKFDGADESDIESTKGGLSAAQKRSAVQWSIGRYLYTLDGIWVDIYERGDNFVKQKLRDGTEVKGYWNTPKLPDWALPKGEESNGNTSTTQTSSNQGSSERATDENIHYIKRCENILGLEDDEKIAIFNYMNSTDIKTLDELYSSSQKLLSKYLVDAIKYPAHIKEEVRQAGMNEKNVIDELNEKSDFEVGSWRNLIGRSTKKTLGYVRKFIGTAQSNQSHAS